MTGHVEQAAGELRADLLTSSIVFLVAGQGTPQAELQKRLTSGEASKRLGGRVTVTQGIVADSERGVLPSFTIDNIRSRQTVVINPIRVEVHDRSGEMDLQKTRLVEMAGVALDIAGVESVQAVGVNFEFALEEVSEERAGIGIAHRLLRPDLGPLPHGSRISGLAVRVFLTDTLGRTSTIAVEPRWNDVESSEISISTNTNMIVATTLADDDLRAFYVEAEATIVQFLRNVALLSQEQFHQESGG